MTTSLKHTNSESKENIMREIKLPLLPGVYYTAFDGMKLFNIKDMLDYATAAVLADRAELTRPKQPAPYDACESFRAYSLSVKREAVLTDEVSRLTDELEKPERAERKPMTTEAEVKGDNT